ncbi:MAG: hypothetical protein HC831_32025, partial [Chloroflexia bacterium]|nr:hypothetical protein [Chloroflexia bacterium]
EIGELANLERLYLTENKLVGEVPFEVAKLPSLKRLYLCGNAINSKFSRKLTSVLVVNKMDVKIDKI